MLQESRVDLVNSPGRPPFADLLHRSHALPFVAVSGVAQRFDQASI